jgi:hypothetical protein
MAQEFSLEEALGKGTQPTTEFSLDEALGRAPTKDRTVGEAFKDVGAGLVSGAGALVQLPGQLYGLATGDFSKTGALGLGEDISEYGEEMKSAGLKAREAERAAKVQEAEKEGQFAAFKAGFGETITDPGLFTSFIAEQVPNILPMILTGGATAALTAGRASAAALAKGATKEAAAAAGKSAGAKAGTTAAIQTGAVMQGADIGAGSYDEIYGELLAKGLSEEQAAAETINKARAAGLTGYGLSVLANRFLPGGKALEEILAGKKITGSRIGSGAVTALKEIPSENIEEVGGRIAQNVAAQQAGLDRELLAGTGETAAMATLGAIGIGGAAGALAPRRSESEQAAKEVDAFKQEEEEFRKQFGKAEPVEVKEPELPTEFPGGYTATRRELSRQDVPESYGIFPEGADKPLTTVQTQEEAQAKLQTLTEIRAEEQARLIAESDKIDKEILAERRKLDVLEATGQTDTDQYVQSKAALLQREEEAAQQVSELNDRIASYSTPLTLAPVGSRTDVQSDYVVKRGDQEIGAFPTLQDAETRLREIEPETFTQAEQQAQVKTDDRVQQLKNTLTPMLAKFGLQDVGLNVVAKIENDAGGKYSSLDRLIDISLRGDAPIQTMRHESLHALKDLQFFTPQQWNALTERANKQWIKEYLQDQQSVIEVDGKPQTMSRLDAYKRLGYTQEAIVEEAIADAFGAYDKGATPPPGMIAALFKKLKNFFLNFGQALRGAGFESADDVFQRIERGDLKSSKPKAKIKAETVTKAPEKQEEVKKPKVSAPKISVDKAKDKAAVKLAKPKEKTTGEKANETTRPDQSAVRPSSKSKLSIKQSEERGERGGREQPRKIKILEGAPSVPGFSGPIPEIVETAERYAKENGIPYKRQAAYVKVDPERAGRIAQAYEEMTHAPQDPEVRKAYKDLIRQTTAQYEALLDSGYEFWFMDMSKPDNQKYASSPWNALRDLKDNKQMGVFPTNDGFGSSEDFSPEANPLLADTGFKWPSGSPDGPLQPVLANDLFRAVHDAFGHGIEGAGFRAEGEENAWQAHMRLFTGPAVGAITSETRGQNSWLNYGPSGESNRTAKIEDTVFADQKTGLMPEWTWQEGISDDEGIVLGEKQPDAISVNGSHYGKARVSELDASKYGTGLRGAERRRLDRTDDERIKKRAYFYIAKPDGSTPTPESGVGQYVYTQKFDNILGQGPEMGRLFREANGDSNNFESLIVDAGYDGYAIPEMGMMVILNHNVPVNYVGPRSEVGVAKLSLRIAQPNSILAKRMDGIGIKSINDFWKRIQDVMIGRGDRNPGLSGAFDKRSTADQVKQAISVWKQDVEDEGIESYLNRFTDSKGKIPGLDEIISGPPVVKKMLTEAGIRPTMGNAVAAYNSLKGSSAAEASNDIRYSLRNSFPSAKEAEDAAYDKAPPSTKEFKLFFGGSTIMDEGRPQPMYHGSASEFSTFLENKPIFISPDPDFAEQFAEDRAKDEGKSLDEMRIYPLWVRAETPFDYENKDHAEMVTQKIITDQKLSGPDSVVRLKKSNPKANTFKRELADGLWSIIEDPVVQDALKSFGFDSFYVQEYGNKNLAVFKAEQVKSITGNIGDFSLESKDMRFSLKKVRYSPDRFDKLLSDSVYLNGGAEKTTKGYLGFVRPMDFIYATSNDDTLKRLRTEQEPVNFDKMRALGPISLEMSRSQDNNWKITGHEGRHRMLALADEGYNEIPVFIEFKSGIQNAEAISTKSVKAQDPDSINSSILIADLEPLSYDNQDKAREKFTRMESKVKYSLPTIPQNLQDRMGETTTRRERKTVIQSIIDAITPTSAADFRAKYLNSYNQMSVLDKTLAEQRGGAALLADESAESAALMSDLGAGVAASAMGFDDRNGGIPVLRNGITTIDKSVKGLIASLGPLAAYGDPAIYQRYQYWAMVKRGQRLNKNGTLTGIDSADVAFAKILEQKHPEFVSVQKDLIAFNNGLVQYMVDTGVLSKERGQIYTKYADYIPFYRQMDGDKTLGPNLFQSLSGVKPPKKLKGAIADEAPLADFLETMVRNTQSSIQAGIKNYAAQRAINVAVQVQAPGMGAVRLNTKEDGPDIINVLEKGNLVSYRTPDKLLINAMMSLNQSELPFMGILSAPANLLRNLVTKEPGFMMANMLRDSLSAWVTSGQKMTPIAGTVINFGKAIARTSPGFEAMLDAGIIGGYEFSENIEKSGFKLEDDLAKKAGKKDPILLRPFKSVWDALGKGTTASDAATRALIYERVLADTGNEAEALYRSLEVMNFHRKGSSPLIRVLTAAVPFFNARLQGLDLFYRASTGNMNNKDAASIQRQFFVRGMTMMALSGLYWMLVSDDEEYKKQEQETKDNNWIIPAIGAKIPIPFEVGVLFKVIPERIMAYSFGNDTGEDLQKSMIRAAVSTFAFNPIPQTVKPVLEAVVDYNMFTMRPILGQGMKDIEPEFQVGPSTSNFATLLAQNLGLSPMKVDHIIKGYTGTMGMYAIDTIDIMLDQFGDSPKPTKRFEQLPVIKRFTSDPESRGFVTQYYELKDAVDTTVRTMNLLERTGQYEEYAEYLVKNQGTLAFKDYVRDTEKTLKDLREMRTAIRSSTMTGDEKRDSLLEISRVESAITANIQEIKKAIAQAQ